MSEPHRRVPGGVRRRPPATTVEKTDGPAPAPGAAPTPGGMPFDPKLRPLGMMHDTWEPSILTYLYALGLIAACAFVYVGSLLWGLVLIAGVALLFTVDRAFS